MKNLKSGSKQTSINDLSPSKRGGVNCQYWGRIHKNAWLIYLHVELQVPPSPPLTKHANTLVNVVKLIKWNRVTNRRLIWLGEGQISLRPNCCIIDLRSFLAWAHNNPYSYCWWCLQSGCRHRSGHDLGKTLLQQLTTMPRMAWDHRRSIKLQICCYLLSLQVRSDVFPDNRFPTILCPWQ